MPTAATTYEDGTPKPRRCDLVMTHEVGTDWDDEYNEDTEEYDEVEVPYNYWAITWTPTEGSFYGAYPFYTTTEIPGAAAAARWFIDTWVPAQIAHRNRVAQFDAARRGRTGGYPVVRGDYPVVTLGLNNITFSPVVN